MTIRSLHTTDLFRVLLDNHAMGPDWAQTWEKVGGNRSGAFHTSIMASGLLLRREKERCSVAVDGMRLRALASVRSRSGPRAWEIDRLNLPSELEQEVPELLDRLCVLVGDKGGERVFLRLPGSTDLKKWAREAGFLPCFQETLYCHEAAPSSASLTAKYIRPFFPSDEHPVFRLYNTCVPSEVKSVCALTIDEWSDAQEPLGTGVQQGVYEDQGRVRGWVRVGSGKHCANRLETLMHQEEDTSAWEDMVSWGLRQGRATAPFLALVPDYQPTLSLVLEKKGFIPAGEYHLMVKSIAARVKDSALAPVGA